MHPVEGTRTARHMVGEFGGGIVVIWVICGGIWRKKSGKAEGKVGKVVMDVF
jgi:hypothetical protein